MEWNVIFDTMNSWTVVTGDYNQQNSTTHRSVYVDKNNTTPMKVTLDFQPPFIGTVFNESMCLIQKSIAGQNGAKPTVASGRLCVSQFPFAYAKDKVTIDGASVGGVVGISPAKASHNYVWRLFEQGLIKRAVVGINYEKWGDYHQRSRISMGSIDFNEIVDGEDGANYYSNLGGDYWGLMIDDFMYANEEMTENQ